MSLLMPEPTASGSPTPGRDRWWDVRLYNFEGSIAVPHSIYTVRASVRWYGLERYFVSDRLVAWGWTLRPAPRRVVRTDSNHVLEIRYHRDPWVRNWMYPHACEVRWDGMVLTPDLFAEQRARVCRLLAEAEEREKAAEGEASSEGWFATVIAVLSSLFGPR